MKWNFIHYLANSREGLVKYHAKTSRSLLQFWSVKTARRKIIVIPICLLLLYFSYYWTIESNSCALHAFLCLILFDITSIIGDTICQFYMHGKKATSGFSFGFIRAEVLIHFSILCSAILFNLWALYTSFILIFSQDILSINTGVFFPTIFAGGFIHFFLVLPNNPFTKVLKLSSITTSFQKHGKEIASALGVNSSTSTNPFLGPFAVVGIFYTCILFSLTLVLYSRLIWVDFVAGLFLIYASMDLIWPLTLYTSQVLLQTVPMNVCSLLEKALREAMTIDGVLEFRNELFWTLTYGQTAGNVNVRVRRDANEQVILAKVYEKLSPIAQHLTIQITKDEVINSRGFNSIYQIGGHEMTSVQISGIGSDKLELGGLSTPMSAEISPIQPPSHLKPNKQIIYSTASSTSSNYHNPNHQSQRPSIHNMSDDSILTSTANRPISAASTASPLFNFEIPSNQYQQGFYEYNTQNNQYQHVIMNPSPSLQQQPPQPIVPTSTSTSAFYPITNNNQNPNQNPNHPVKK